jgi:hypothetical protein
MARSAIVRGDKIPNPSSVRGDPPRKNRTRLSRRLLPSSNGGSLWARLTRDTLYTLIAHCGGEQHISVTRRIAARRAAALETELRFIEDMLASAREEERDVPTSVLDTYGKIAERQRRLCEALGWSRTARDVTPTLDEYLKQRAQSRPRDDDDDDIIDAEAEEV